ncbi:MAG: PIN domain-containing protein [Candidatus Margulisiibacteriota bacterium]|jgi:predicted nucleic acid-binding protein
MENSKWNLTLSAIGHCREMRNTLIDTSVWIDFFNGKLTESSKSKVADLLMEDKACFDGIILAELMVGANPKDEQFIKTNFEGMHYLEADQDFFVNAAKKGNQLKRKGLSIPLNDILIFQHAYQNNLCLMTRDSHFKAIQEHFSYTLLFL